MPRPAVSVTIVTLNEKENLAHAIESVRWADEILVVDSGSTDGTVELAKALGARVLHNPWQGYGQQKNFAQQQAAHDWILNIDADEVVPPTLADEIRSALEQVEAGQLKARGFRFPRKTFYLGHWIRYGGWYPNVLCRMADRRHASWTEPHLHEELAVRGEVIELREDLHHYSFPSIRSQVLTNLRYAQLGSDDLARAGKHPSLAKLLLKPLGKFFETFILKRGFLDGLPGFIISINAAYSMFLKYAFLMEKNLKRERPPIGEYHS